MDRVVITGGSGFIGTNLIEWLLNQNQSEIVSLDIKPPQLPRHRDLWRYCSILDRDELCSIVSDIQPRCAIHLAGRTDMAGKCDGDYAANHIGTANFLTALQNTSTIERAIFTSSQFVIGPGIAPATEDDYHPHTIYGRSKVLSELAIRNSGADFVWTIVRPTNIWGKWHPRYPSEFWRVLKQGRYIHPGAQAVRRCYGYVGTVVQQLSALLAAPVSLVNKQMFYLGDPPIDLREWTDAFSLELTGHPVTVVPRAIVRTLAVCGDAAAALGKNFPITSSRYRSMTQEYLTPMQKTFDCLGSTSVPLSEGVRETVDWLRTQGAFWTA